jgi:hypothetical protein
MPWIAEALQPACICKGEFSTRSVSRHHRSLRGKRVDGFKVTGGRNGTQAYLTLNAKGRPTRALSESRSCRDPSAAQRPAAAVDLTVGERRIVPVELAAQRPARTAESPRIGFSLAKGMGIIGALGGSRGRPRERRSWWKWEDSSSSDRRIPGEYQELGRKRGAVKS